MLSVALMLDGVAENVSFVFVLFVSSTTDVALSVLPLPFVVIDVVLVSVVALTGEAVPFPPTIDGIIDSIEVDPPLGIPVTSGGSVGMGVCGHGAGSQLTLVDQSQ
jgi:hypothetical protein